MPRYDVKRERSLYPLPAVIDNGLRKCVKLYIPDEPSHRQAFIGAIYNLTRWYAWERDDEKTGRQIAAVWSEVFAQMLADMDSGCEENTPCFRFRPNAPFIEWIPQNPYTQPNETPNGYLFPPWYIANGVTALVFGCEAGDVLTSIERITAAPPDWTEPVSGLPQFIIRLSGAGVCKLHLQTIYSGGQLQITVDEQLSSLRLIDLRADVVGVPPELATALTIEIEIPDAGEHRIDCIAVPTLQDDAPFITFGAAVKYIELCGFDSTVEATNMFQLRQSPTDSCLLEQTLDGGLTWIPAFDFAECDAIGTPAEPDFTRYNEQGIYEESYDGGQTWQERKDRDERYSGARDAPYSGGGANCLAAHNIVAVLRTLVDQVSAAIANAGTVVTIVSLLAGFLVFIFTGGAALPLVFPFVTFMLTLGAGGITAAFTQTFYDALECLLLCEIPADGIVTEAVYNNIMNAVSAEAGVAYQATWLAFKILGPVGLDRSAHRGGITSADCSDCDTCPTCERDYDFLGAILHSDVEVRFGAHVPGEGVKTVAWTSYTDYAEVWVYFDQPCTARQAYVTCYSQNGTGNQLGVYWYNRQPDGSYTQITAGNYALQTGVSTAAPGCPASYDAIRLMLNPANNRKRALHKLRLEPS